MPGRRAGRLLFGALLLGACSCPVALAQEEWLSWSASRAEGVGQAMRQSGRVGGLLDLRVRSTNKSYNFKLRATWLSPDAIRAGARLIQLQERLSEADARSLVARAEEVADTIIIVELDPREGSGVIPLEWTAHLQPKGRPQGPVVRGSLMPRLRDIPVLKGIFKRDYDYDVFWVAFPLATSGRPLFDPEDREAELVVRIEGKEGRVSWTIPPSLRALPPPSVRPEVREAPK